MFRKRQWSGDEIWQLYERFPAEGPQRLAAELGRSEGSVNSQASRLRLRSLTRRVRQSQTRKLKEGQRSSRAGGVEERSVEVDRSAQTNERDRN